MFDKACSHFHIQPHFLIIDMTDQKKQPKSQNPSVEDGISTRLKTARETLGLSQTELHRVTGLSRMVISKYESGQNKPGTREIRLLCDALNTNPSYLIYGTDEPHKKPEGLAATLLSMGEHALVPAAMLVPMIGAILGQDDSRVVLNLIETLLKAKNPREHAMLSELLNTMKDSIENRLEELADLETNVALQETFQSELKQRMMDAIEKVDKK